MKPRSHHGAATPRSRHGAWLLALLACALVAAPALAAPTCCVPAATPGPERAQERGPQEGLAPITLRDPQGQPVRLPDGRLWVVAFFYGSCPDVCPVLLSDLGAIAARLPAAWRDRVAVAGISFDPGRDAPERLGSLAARVGLAGPARYLLTGSPEEIKRAEAACGFQYAADGEGRFRHVNMLALIDGEGRVFRHFYGLQPEPALVTDALRARLR
jgi:protein SCO1/2